MVRTLKVAGRDQVMQIMDYLDNMEEESHKFYPHDSCPMEGGYKASTSSRPSGFLSPRTGGTEGGVKTIEERLGEKGGAPFG